MDSSLRCTHQWCTVLHMHAYVHLISHTKKWKLKINKTQYISIKWNIWPQKANIKACHHRMGSVNSVWSERSQSQRPCLILFHFYELSRRGKSIETESRLVVAEGWQGKGKVGLLGEGWSLKHTQSNLQRWKCLPGYCNPLWLLSRCWQRKLWQFLLAVQCFCRGTSAQSCMLCHLTKVTPRFTFKVLWWLLLRFYGGRSYQNSLNCFKNWI